MSSNIRENNNWNNSRLRQGLGLQVDETALIIHCDDVGLCRDANEGSFMCIEEGVATSGSVMMPCPWSQQACEYAAAHPDLDIGVHLTLTAEWDAYRWSGLRCAEVAPSLHDADGFLWHRAEQSAEHADTQEALAEMIAQVKKARLLGLSPSHIDTHMATVFHAPELTRAYIELGVANGLPTLISLNPDIYRAFDINPEPAMPVLEALTSKHNLPVLDSALGGTFEEDYETKWMSYANQLRNVGPGFHQMVIHPMKVTEEAKAAVRTWKGRENDLRFCLDPRTRELLDELGFRLTTWREVGQVAMNKVNS